MNLKMLHVVIFSRESLPTVVNVALVRSNARVNGHVASEGVRAFKCHTAHGAGDCPAGVAVNVRLHSGQALRTSRKIGCWKQGNHIQ